MNLFIGLCFGIAAALVLAILWRMAEQLRRELQADEDRRGPDPMASDRKLPRDR